MPYATQDDLVPLRMTLQDLVELTDDSTSDDDPGAGQVNAAIVTGALTEASARIDSYCRQRYLTPLQPSDTIKGIALDITVYLLFTRRRTTKPNETVAQRYNDAVKFLQDIAAGHASLDQPATAAEPQMGSSSATVTAKRQTFDEHHLSGWSR